MMINEKIRELQKEIASYPITTPEQLQVFKHKFLSKKGVLPSLFAQLKSLSPEQKKATGKLLNQLRTSIQEKYTQHHQPSQTTSQSSRCEDITLPPPPAHLGALHPLTQITDKIIQIFQRIGFNLAEGPEIESAKNNFTLLNFQKDHPAIDMQDTFYTKSLAKQKNLLRTHTSSVQTHVLKKKSPPIRVLSTGKVFRRETISARTHCVFHQLEALYLDKNVNFLELKATIFFLYVISSAQKQKYVYAPLTSPSPSPVQK